MKIIKANAELIKTAEHPYIMVERAGRTCYKSEDNITPESATRFVKMMVKNGHLAMLEHAYLHIYCNMQVICHLKDALSFAKNISPSIDRYLIITEPTSYNNDIDMSAYGLVSGSLRAFYELVTNPVYINKLTPYYEVIGYINNFLAKIYPEVFSENTANYVDLTDIKQENISSIDSNLLIFRTNDMPESEDDMILQVVTTNKLINTYETVAVTDANITTLKQLLSSDTMYEHIPHTLKFTCDRGVSHEFVRHRPASFAQESTRYCNYNKDKFGSEITVIKPVFFDEESADYQIWKNACESSELAYMNLLDNGATAQEARSVLPNSLKTELIITANEREWNHILDLRLRGTTGKPHPQMIEVMEIAAPILFKESDNRLS